MRARGAPDRVLVDASLGLRVPEGMGFLTGFAIEGSVTNLTDKKYVSTIGSNGFGNSGDSQTLLAGAPAPMVRHAAPGFLRRTLLAARVGGILASQCYPHWTARQNRSAQFAALLGERTGEHFSAGAPDRFGRTRRRL